MGPGSLYLGGLDWKGGNGVGQLPNLSKSTVVRTGISEESISWDEDIVALINPAASTDSLATPQHYVA